MVVCSTVAECNDINACFERLRGNAVVRYEARDIMVTTSVKQTTREYSIVKIDYLTVA